MKITIFAFDKNKIDYDYMIIYLSGEPQITQMVRICTDFIFVCL